MRDVTSDDAAGLATAGVVDARLTALQLALASFRLPVAAHAAFNAAAALAILLLGHPILAAWLFVGATAFDAVMQRLLKTWLAASEGADEAAGLRRLAVLSGARAIVYTAPTLTMAAGGGSAELMFYGLQLATLLCVALGASALSRTVFWAFAAPMAVETAVLAGLLFDPMTAAGVLVGLLGLMAVAATVSAGASTTISAWHKAFILSVAERVAADAAGEAARSASRARSTFLATMSHEIRTPMNGVLGMAQLLKRDETDPRQVERLDVLIDSGEYLLSILNDILDVSKIDAGRLEIVTAPEDLRAVLDRLVAFWGPRADEQGVRLGLEVADDVPAMVLVDALRLRQVLFNLVGNALKFTEAGSVDVVAEAARRDGDTVLLRLAVRDTGPGIAAHHLPHLFDRFSQADGSEARRFGGTGLGLAIVRQLVELMGGQVSVESVLGEGSVFRVEIPLTVADAAVETVAEPGAGEPLALEALRVLAVDDNTVNLLVLDQLLTSLGLAVARAASGQEALDILARTPFDIVLTDIQMPGMTGVEVLQRLRATPGLNQHVPVIALTADVTSGGRQRYLDLGFTEHSPKPIQLPDLIGAINRAAAAGPALAERAA
jgi:signal transduction histidine kinase/ActR/RegA family two-component response regulator